MLKQRTAETNAQAYVCTLIYCDKQYKYVYIYIALYMFEGCFAGELSHNMFQLLNLFRKVLF